MNQSRSVLPRHELPMKKNRTEVDRLLRRRCYSSAARRRIILTSGSGELDPPRRFMKKNRNEADREKVDRLLRRRCHSSAARRRIILTSGSGALDPPRRFMKKNPHAANPHACKRIEGGSSSPLLDAKTWRRSRINSASPAERPIHLLTLIAIGFSLFCATSFAQTADTVAQREVQRRQSAIPQGEAALIRAKAAMKAKNFTVAHDEFRTAVTYLPDAVVSGKAHDEAVEGFCKSGVILAEARIAQGDYAGAEAILSEILSDRYDPNCRPARELLTHLRQPGYFNKTMGPRFIAKVEEVKQLLTEADGFYKSGRYDLAFKRYEQVLKLDPYNVAARRGQEQLDHTKYKYGVEAYNETRARSLWEVEKGWEEPVREYGRTVGELGGAVAREASGTARITNKLNTIIIPRVEFRDASIREAIDFLREQAVENDPSPEGKKGVDIVLRMTPLGQVAPPPVPVAPAAGTPGAAAAPAGAPTGGTKPVTAGPVIARP